MILGVSSSLPLSDSIEETSPSQQSDYSSFKSVRHPPIPSHSHSHPSLSSSSLVVLTNFSFLIFLPHLGNDPAATEALAELDDDLGSDIRDIVDTAPYKPGQGAVSKDWVIKVLMGGINRRIDRRAA